MEGTGHEVDVTFQERTAIISLPIESLKLLPGVYRNAGTAGVEIKLVTVLFNQGIDMQQSIAFASQTTTDGYRNSGELQRVFNMKSLSILNTYCHSLPQTNALKRMETTLNFLADGEEVHFVMHNMSKTLQDTPVGQKNVSVLECLEDIAVQLDALRVTFCKSGKDRTGMAVTLEQSRYMARKFGIGTNNKDIVIHNANIMREYGTRLDVVEKNIKKRCYAINAIQATFLPEEYKPPSRVLEDLIRNDGDNT